MNQNKIDLVMEIVSFEIAKKLKEKGFTLPKSNVIGKFDSDGVFHSQLYINFTETMDSEEIIAPTISQVLKWLREEKGWVIVVRLYSTNGWYWFVQDEKGELKSSHLASCDDCFSTYELAAIAGVNYCLENLI